jgi:hypothetical protein
VQGYPGICGKNPRAILAWIKTRGTPAVRLPFVAWGQNQPGAYWLIEVDEDQRLRLSCGSGFVSANEQQVGDGNWHHIAVVLDPVDEDRPLISDALLYVDGQRRTIYKMEEARIDTGCIENLSIGAAHGLVESNFAGVMDEVMIFDATIGPTSVRDVYLK